MWHRCDRSAAIVVVSFFFHVSDVALSKLSLLAKPIRPAAGAGHADPKPGCSLMTGRARGYGRLDTLA